MVTRPTTRQAGGPDLGRSWPRALRTLLCVHPPLMCLAYRSLGVAPRFLNGTVLAQLLPRPGERHHVDPASALPEHLPRLGGARSSSYPPGIGGIALGKTALCWLTDPDGERRHEEPARADSWSMLRWRRESTGMRFAGSTSWRRCCEVGSGLPVAGLPIGVSAKTGDRPTSFLLQGFVGSAEWNDRIQTPAKTPGRQLLPLLT